MRQKTHLAAWEVLGGKWFCFSHALRIRNRGVFGNGEGGITVNVFSQTLDAVKKSWKILMADKELIIFPVLSGILCLLVSASFYFPISASGHDIVELYTQDRAGFIVLAFLFYFFNYFLITFFNCAVIACAEIRMAGGNPTLSDGFKASWSVVTFIAAWAMVEATVGMVLKMLQGRGGRRNLITGGLGALWTMASFFVAPRLVIDRIDPFTALKSAWSDVKGNWGHQLVGGISFELLTFLAVLPAFLFLLKSGFSNMVAVAFAVIWILLVALLISTLKSIFQASLYLSMKDRAVR
ncbi:MAG: hypothetical protein KAR40_15880 [Candidatus Sabulitectum sp.]|nr:hypothetical protein [Candidatus Sabulitectum sp.]